MRQQNFPSFFLKTFRSCPLSRIHILIITARPRNRRGGVGVVPAAVVAAIKGLMEDEGGREKNKEKEEKDLSVQKGTG